MRYFLVVVSLLSLANFATAREEQVVLSLSTGGGNAPPQMQGWANEVLIYESGKVTARSRQNGESPWMEKTISTIDQSVMQGLKGDIGELVAGDLAFPDTPECYDFPTTVYYGLNKLGEKVVFAAYSGCRLGVLPEFWRAERLVEMLAAHSMLASYVMN